jgi:hypothetical protein
MSGCYNEVLFVKSVRGTIKMAVTSRKGRMIFAIGIDRLILDFNCLIILIII